MRKSVQCIPFFTSYYDANKLLCIQCNQAGRHIARAVPNSEAFVPQSHHSLHATGRDHVQRARRCPFHGARHRRPGHRRASGFPRSGDSPNAERAPALAKTGWRSAFSEKTKTNLHHLRHTESKLRPGSTRRFQQCGRSMREKTSAIQGFTIVSPSPRVITLLHVILAPYRA